MSEPRVSHVIVERKGQDYIIGVTKRKNFRWSRLKVTLLCILLTNLDPHGTLEEVNLETDGVLQAS